MSLNSEIIKIKSKALEGNFLHDAYDREILAFYPEKLEEGAPLLIELAGLNGTPKLNNRFSQVLNKLYKKNNIENAVVINPNFSTKYHVNQYLNSPAVGNYEDFIINEIIPEMKKRYHTGKVGLFGKSSGGFGAYSLAVRHPDVISGFADHFGDSCFEYVYIPDMPIAFKELKDKNINEYIEEMAGTAELTDDQIKTLNIIGMSAFYSYNKDSEMGFDLPFDRDMGSFKNEVWQKWLKFDPAKNVDSYQSQLKQLDAIYLDVGNRDEYSLFIGMKTLHEKLSKLGIKHEFHEFDGGHFYNTTRYENSIPFLIENLKQ
ncbi:MAG: alpha/beta hydrolase-fold protein [Ferroplasma sp.]